MPDASILFPDLTLFQGLLETRALTFAENHAAIWETFILKPGGVVPKKLLNGGVFYRLLELLLNPLGEKIEISNRPLF